VAEWLLGRGCEVAIWDPDLDTGRLTGANQAYIEERLPHLARLVCSTPAEALDEADVALLGTVGDDVLAELGRRPRITVIDAEGSLSVELRDRSADYQGVAW